MKLCLQVKITRGLFSRLLFPFLLCYPLAMSPHKALLLMQIPLLL